MRIQWILAVLAVCLLTACGDTNSSGESTAESSETISEDSLVYRGERITAEDAIPVEELAEQMNGQQELFAKVEGEVLSCCQQKGCWMMVNLGNGKTMRVTFKDYGFFVPFESAGRTVVMEGKAYYDTVSVDMVRHYAEDAGKTEAEIAAITEPEVGLAFEASGLILR